MKIKRLTMNGFGPYATEVDIDFTKLNEDGLFLITGNTGAGKSTIFDGISYTLYGEVSSKNTEKKNGIICDFLQPEEYKNVYLELEFSIGEIEYKIKRTPKYQNHTKTGKSETLEVYKNGKILTIAKKNDLESYIKTDIIKLEQDQFNKIMILPQGSFNEFIKTNSDDKAAILNKIFGTDFYKRFEQELINAYKGLESQIKSGREKTLTMIQSAHVVDNPSWNREIIEFSNQIEILREEVEKHDINLKENDKEKKNLLVLKELILKIIDLDERVEKENKTIEHLENTIRNIDIENKEIIENKKLYKDKEESSIQNLEKLKGYQGEVRELLQKKDKIKGNLDINKNYEILKDSIQDEVKEKTKELENLNKEYTLLEEKIKIRRVKEEQLNIRKLKLKDLKIGITLSEDIEKNITTLDIKKTKLDQLRESKNERHEIYNNSHELFIRESAYILSESLKEGEPCPVCGNIEHKCYPQKPEKSPTKEELEKNKIQYEESERFYSKALGEHESLKTLESRQLKELNQWAESQGVTPSFDAIKEHYNLFEHDIKLVENDIKKMPSELDIENMRNRIKKYENTIKQSQDKVLELDKSIIQIKAQNSELTIRIDDIEEKFIKNKVNSEKLNEEIESQNKEFIRIREILKGIDSIIKSRDEKKALLANSKINFEELKNQQGEYKLKYDILIQELNLKELESDNEKYSEEDSTDINQFKISHLQILEILKVEITKLEEKRESILVDRSSLTGPLNHLESYKDELEQKINEFEMLDVLLKIAKGTHPSQRDKISFEKYVLRVYFQEVLDSANIRFNKMTNGQYTIRIAEDTNKTGKIGLELNVFDTHTGKERSIMTLSGGESFKASMALALGLSDVVQFKNGGIALDSVFIDEGFGTLDEESLSSAMDILIDLKSSGRTVGIISHVTELKNTIPSQIIVEKMEKGSRAYLKY